MPVDRSGSSVALSQLQSIPFGTLIGGPLNAVVEAQAVAAQTSIDFIEKIGLRENADGETEAITVSFLYQSAEGTTQTLTVPLIVLVPIPFIQVDNVTIQFKAKITASGSGKQARRKSVRENAAASFRAGSRFARGAISGSLSSKKDSVATRESAYSVEYTIDVQVNASQAGMPAGLAVILKILEESIVAREPSNELLLIPQDELRLTAVGQTVKVDVVALGTNNKPVPGVTITPTFTGASLTAPVPPNTNAFGRTTVEIKAAALTTAEQAVEIAFVGAAGEFSASETLEITLPAGPPPALSDLALNASTTSMDESATATITATVTDSNGDPLSGATVTITTNNSEVAPAGTKVTYVAAPTTGVTGADGLVTITLAYATEFGAETDVEFTFTAVKDSVTKTNTQIITFTKTSTA